MRPRDPEASHVKDRNATGRRPVQRPPALFFLDGQELPDARREFDVQLHVFPQPDLQRVSCPRDPFDRRRQQAKVIHESLRPDNIAVELSAPCFAQGVNVSNRVAHGVIEKPGVKILILLTASLMLPFLTLTLLQPARLLL